MSYIWGKPSNVKDRVKNKILARCWWLTPVILATQETKIRRTVVRRQPREIVHKILS
jgi:hypothetical protein